MRALLSLQLNDSWIALDAAAVLEIRGAQPWVAIPDAPAATPGVIAWRGRAVAVIDLAALLRLGEPLAPGAARPRAVIASMGAATCALPVDGVREVQEIPIAELRPPHATRTRFASAEVRLHEQLMPLLDLQEMSRELCGAGQASHGR